MSLVIKLGNKRTGATGEYIGRGSPLGNPFYWREGEKVQFLVENRAKAIEAYEDYLNMKIEQSDEKILKELDRLFSKAMQGPITLVCFCHPLPCHGSVIRDVLLRGYEKAYGGLIEDASE